MSKDDNEASVKMPEDPKESSVGQFNLDGILSELGSFGKYQLLLLLLLGFRDAFLQMCNFNYVFTAAEVGYRCEVPECEDQVTEFNTSWVPFTIADHADTCYRLAPLHSDPLNITEESRQWFSTDEKLSDSCSYEHFSQNQTVSCKKLVYEDYNSVVAEFDLGCQPWKRTLIGTVHNLGLIFSFVMCGFVSDRYGRKVVIVGSPLVVGAVGLVKSFSVNYWMLLVLEFLETALGYGNASMVLSLETVTQKQRVTYSCVWDIVCSLGSAFFGLIAWKIPYWRHLMRAIYAPLLVAVFYIFLVDEGVRWLLAHGRGDEAVKVLQKVAKINNITLSQNAKAMLDVICEKTKSVEAGGGAGGGAGSVRAALRSRTIVLRLALIAASFACGVFLMNGTIINSTSISGNKYINFSAMLLVSIPPRVVMALTLTRFGRKAPICVAYLLCALFFITSAFVPKSIWWAPMVLYLAGKMCSSFGVFSLWVVALEAFPTSSRHSLCNLASTVARLGAVLAPQAPLLERYMSGLPSVVFGLAALAAAALATALPDTSRAPLPADLADAENIDRADPRHDETSRRHDGTDPRHDETSRRHDGTDPRHDETSRRHDGADPRHEGTYRRHDGADDAPPMTTSRNKEVTRH